MNNPRRNKLQAIIDQLEELKSSLEELQEEVIDDEEDAEHDVADTDVRAVEEEQGEEHEEEFGEGVAVETVLAVAPHEDEAYHRGGIE